MGGGAENADAIWTDNKRHDARARDQMDLQRRTSARSALMQVASVLYAH